MRGLLHCDEESGLYYIDYLRVLQGELEYPDNFGEYLDEYSSKLEALLGDLKDPRARSKLEWMQRYHDRVQRLTQGKLQTEDRK